MDRAYSFLDVKRVDERSRTFSGVATTPTFDRMHDRVDPLKAVYAEEIPLLHAHDHSNPVGTVRLGKATKSGIPFEATIPFIEAPPSLKERVDVAYAELVHGLVKAVSIGFRITEEPTLNEKGGFDYGGIEILELSTVSVPAQSEALVQTVKSFDEAAMRRAGVVPPAAAEDQIHPEPAPAATGKSVRVVRLNDPARDRAEPFVVREIRR